MEAKIRKWGNSYGILLPKEEIEKMSVKENEIVYVTLQKKSTWEGLFGICKGKSGMSTQEFKDEIRKEEKKDDEKLLRQLRSH